MRPGGWDLPDAVVTKLNEATLDGVAKFAVRVKTTNPGAYTWCSGHEPVTISSVKYKPKGMKLPELELGGQDSKSSLIVEDIFDPHGSPWRSLAEHNYTERFSGLEVNWYLGWVERGSWQAIYAVTWYVKQCHWRTNQFRLELQGSAGKYPKAGLPAFSRRCNLTFKGTLCATGAGPSLGTPYNGHVTCSGTEADCEARHGTKGPSNILPFRGMIYAPEPGETIELRAPFVGGGGGASYTFGYGYTQRDREPGGKQGPDLPRVQALDSSGGAVTNGTPVAPDDGSQQAVTDFIQSALA